MLILPLRLKPVNLHLLDESIFGRTVLEPKREPLIELIK